VSFYRRWVIPRLTHLAMRKKELHPYRRRALAQARGRVLEIGIGSGLNLPFYGSEVTGVVGVDPSPALLAMARKEAGETGFPVELLERSAEELPIEDRSIDTAITSWSLCSIPDAARALREVRRTLKPGGRLLFVEHGLAPDPEVVRWQKRLTPLWKRCSGGCHLDRPIDRLVREAGFAIEALETGYARGPRMVAFFYEGRASPG
jgi:ubiquinone/menaquinone biosynthesis C-methylase UbiE